MEEGKKGYLKMTSYEILQHEFVDMRVIQLSVNNQNVICIPIEMLAVHTFFRSIFKPNHPEKLVHDVILNIISEFDSKVMEVLIYDMEGELYHAKMLLRDADGREHYIELESSDALAVALKAPCNVYVSEEVFRQYAESRVRWYDAYAPDIIERLSEMSPESFETYNEYDLKLFLRKAIEVDEFEIAAFIQKALNKKI
ncbi:MAG: bifunctional nuclease family protein [Tannerella sp.]|jgi:bifunctional DNase/RNase|nr:bifunctional nuclease family protein [Tannerella sp.]